jgi:hypothetical protein
MCRLSTSEHHIVVRRNTSCKFAAGSNLVFAYSKPAARNCKIADRNTPINEAG